MKVQYIKRANGKLNTLAADCNKQTLLCLLLLLLPLLIRLELNLKRAKSEPLSFHLQLLSQIPDVRRQISDKLLACWAWLACELLPSQRRNSSAMAGSSPSREHRSSHLRAKRRVLSPRRCLSLGPAGQIRSLFLASRLRLGLGNFGPNER